MGIFSVPFHQAGTGFDVDPPKSDRTVAVLSVHPPSGPILLNNFTFQKQNLSTPFSKKFAEIDVAGAMYVSSISDRRAVGGIAVFVERLHRMDEISSSIWDIFMIMITAVVAMAPLFITDSVVDLDQDKYRPLRVCLALLFPVLWFFLFLAYRAWWARRYYLPYYAEWLSCLSSGLQDVKLQLKDEFDDKYDLGWSMGPSKNDSFVLVYVVDNGKEETPDVVVSSTVVPSEERTTTTLTCETIISNTQSQLEPAWRTYSDYQFANMWRWGALVLTMRSTYRPFGETHKRHQWVSTIMAVFFYLTLKAMMLHYVPNVWPAVLQPLILLPVAIVSQLLLLWYTEAVHATHRHDAYRLALDEYTALDEDHFTYRVDPQKCCCMKLTIGKVEIYSQNTNQELATGLA